ncbi:hypothetical protein XELAEV_18005491mg [Xenopus laevis]|uniref:Uncharacterized protein n=1 Tax=Xenopus laevis TaxID=8355 RepID=A0A974I3A2_XENLA|nr:hypothetical protein XELAEV_18005491mg [Xenopus laevis]
MGSLKLHCISQNEKLIKVTKGTPKTHILAIIQDLKLNQYQSLLEALLLAKRIITQNWRNIAALPTFPTWKQVMQDTCSIEQLMYTKRKVPTKFNKIWGSWPDLYPQQPIVR